MITQGKYQGTREESMQKKAARHQARKYAKSSKEPGKKIFKKSIKELQMK